MEQEIMCGEIRNNSSSLSNNNFSLNRATCKYFLQNSCRYGDRCRNLHIDSEYYLKKCQKISCHSFFFVILFVANTSQNEGNVSQIQQQGIFLINSNADPTIDPDTWIQAPEFVPKSNPSQTTRTFAEIVGTNYPHNYSICSSSSSSSKSSGGGSSNANNSLNNNKKGFNADSELCPYLLGSGECYYDPCEYLHGDMCELCLRFCLHPYDLEQQKTHNIDCIAQHEKDMELSFAIQKSKDKTCGVCFETIMEKPGREQRFGILPNCIHCFCLECIRKWRQAEQFDNKIKRSCPECRITSDFVCPSTFWVDTKDEKEKLINDYKDALQNKDCKYFNKVRFNFFYLQDGFLLFPLTKIPLEKHSFH